MSVRHVSLLIAVACVPSAAVAQAPVETEGIFTSGRLAEGEKTLAARVEAAPEDDHARFALGTVRFLQGVERLGQFLHRHGVGAQTRQVPFVRLPVPPNPDPAPTTYADYRKMLETLLADLAEAEATLAAIDGDVKLSIPFGQVRLDLDGSGEATDEEALWRLYAALNQQVGGQPGFEEQAKQFRIAFDTGDVYWLRGYCHLLSALIEVQLAYDGQQWFDHCGHLLFAKAESPYPFLTAERPQEQEWDPAYFLDLLAAVHLFDFELKEPQRMAAAREHLLAMTDLSRKSWDAIVAETDDDAEWLPNPRQRSVVGVAVTAEMIDTWRQVMAELEDLLNGETLVPFWRGTGQGVNLERVFTEPRPFDLVLWAQGTAAAPYLETGPTTPPETWRRVTQVFRGEFIGFAIWFN
ncbi:MAG TPA: hypothetical protein VF170_16805 [Planctomycetaceae bacterium]